MGNAQKTDTEDDSFVDELEPGTELLHGQFRIEEFLNSGGFGITYLARDSLERPVVIKECFPSTFCHRSRAIVQPRSRAHQNELKSVVDLFVQEARSLAKLEHPNIVGVHQVFEDNATAYMVLDFVEGRDLLDMLESDDHGLTAPQIKGILKDVLSAVAYIHNQDILHRDISPDNILLDSDMRPVLIDFGAAREEATKKSRVLSALRVVKDGYSPQEFYVQGSAQTPSSDLYALGATFYHLIEGEIPPNSQARLAAIASGEKDLYEPLVDRTKGFDKRFLSAIDKSLQILPKDRLQSAQEWLDMMEGTRRKSRVVTTPIPMSSAAAATAAAERKQKSKLVPLLGSAAVIAIIAVAGLVGTGTLDLSGSTAQEEIASAPAEAEPEAQTSSLAEFTAAEEAAQRDVVTTAEAAAEGAELARVAEAAAVAAAERSEIESAAAKAAEEEAARLIELVAAEEAAQLEAELAAAKAAEEAEASRLAEIAAVEEAAKRESELVEAQAAEEEATRLAEIEAAQEAARREAELAATKAAEEAEVARLAEIAAAEAEARREAELAAAQAAEEEAARLAEIAAAEEAARQEAELAAAKAAEEAEVARLAEVAAAEEAKRREAELAEAQAAEEARLAEIAAAEAAARQEAELAEAKAAAEEAARVEAEIAAAGAAAEEERLAEIEAAEREAELAAAEAANNAPVQSAENETNAAIAASLLEMAAANNAARQARLEQGNVVQEVSVDQNSLDASVEETVSTEPSSTTVLSAWALDLPFEGENGSNVIGEVDAVSPAWALTGTRIVSVNGTPIEQMSEISAVLRETTVLDGSATQAVVLSLEPADGGETFDQSWEFPIVQETALLNGTRFTTRFDGEVWKTFVTASNGNPEDFQVGDEVIALMSTTEAIESRTSLKDILERELADGNEQFSFAVSRAGSMWIVSLTYAGGA